MERINNGPCSWRELSKRNPRLMTSKDFFAFFPVPHSSGIPHVTPNQTNPVRHRSPTTTILYLHQTPLPLLALPFPSLANLSHKNVRMPKSPNQHSPNTSGLVGCDVLMGHLVPLTCPV